MFNGRWWIGIATSLVVFLAVTISPAVTQQKQGARQEKEEINGKSRGDFAQKKSDFEQKIKNLAGSKRAAGKMGGLAKLNLTPDQRAAIEPILRGAKEKVLALKAGAQGEDLAHVKAEVAAIRTEVKKQIAEILTPEQLKLWEQLKERRKEIRAKLLANGGCPAPTQ